MTENENINNRIAAKAEEIAIDLKKQHLWNIDALLIHAAVSAVLLEDSVESEQNANTLARKCYDTATSSMKINSELMQRLEEIKSDDLEFHIKARNTASLLNKTIDELEPYAKRGAAWSEIQRKSGFKRHEEQQKEHDQWRKWQEEEITLNIKFSKLSKEEQARKLKKKHDIKVASGTIAKKLKTLK